jgi:hypothetical protein
MNKYSFFGGYQIWMWAMQFHMYQKYHKDFHIANSSISFHFIYLYWIRLRKNNVPSGNSIFYRRSEYVLIKIADQLSIR